MASFALLATTNNTFAQEEDSSDDYSDSEDFDWAESSDDGDDQVVRLTGENFYQETVGKRVFVEFYDPM